MRQRARAFTLIELLVVIVLLGILVSVAVLSVGGEEMGPQTRHLMHWLAALIGVPVVLVAGMPIYRNALAGLRAGRLTMDMAVALGVLATTGMSLSEVLRNGPYTWFDGATALLALLLAGRVLDRAARRRARLAVALRHRALLPHRIARGHGRPRHRRRTEHGAGHHLLRHEPCSPLWRNAPRFPRPGDAGRGLTLTSTHLIVPGDQGGSSMADTDTLLAQMRLRAASLRMLGYRVRLDLTDSGDSIILDAAGGPCEVRMGQGEEEADTALSLSSDDLARLLAGRLSPMLAFATGKLRVEGSKGVAMKLASLLDED